MKGEWKPEITNKEHHAGDYITSTSIKRALSKTMASWKLAQEEGESDTDAMRLGRLIHIAVFEKDKWDDLVMMAPTNKDGSPLQKRSNADKETWAKFATQLASTGKDYCSVPEKEKCFAISDSVWSNPDAAKWLASGVAEVSGIAESEDYGKLAIRPDWRCADRQVIVDLKSCQSASPNEVPRAIVNFGYALSAAFYVDIARVIDKKDYDFVWIFVEKEPPYNVACYCAPPEVLEYGRGNAEDGRGYEAGISKIISAKAAGEYPARYFDGTMPITLPRWA